MSHRRNGSINVWDAAILEAQRKRLEEELIGAGWNIAEAAKALGIPRVRVYRLVHKLKLMKPGKVMVRRLVKA